MSHAGSPDSVLIAFQATLRTLEGTTLVRLPEDASRQLPSRGQVAVHGTLEGHPFTTVVEPDGRRGHWIRIDRELQEAAGAGTGENVDLTLEVADAWPEPDVPGDLAGALGAAPSEIRAIWEDITPMARWEWVRWVKATANPATRERRVEVSLSKMESGKRRPCCFDLAACTDPQLARSGKLREPS